MVLLGLPVAYLNLSVNWWGSFSSDTVGWQSWLAAANAVGAVLLAIVAAHLTAGLTNVIRPMWLPLWVFGLPVLLYLPMQAYLGLDRSIFIDLSAWLAVSVVFGMMAVRLTRLGRPVTAWAWVAVTAPIVFLLGNLRGLGWYMDPEARIPFFDSLVVTVAFEMVTQPAFHLTVFKLAYVRSLAARVRTADHPQREAVRAPL